MRDAPEISFLPLTLELRLISSKYLVQGAATRLELFAAGSEGILVFFGGGLFLPVIFIMICVQLVTAINCSIMPSTAFKWIRC
jgi:hypothetical protein